MIVDSDVASDVPDETNVSLWTNPLAVRQRAFVVDGAGHVMVVVLGFILVTTGESYALVPMVQAARLTTAGFGLVLLLVPLLAFALTTAWVIPLFGLVVLGSGLIIEAQVTWIGVCVRHCSQTDASREPPRCIPGMTSRFAVHHHLANDLEEVVAEPGTTTPLRGCTSATQAARTSRSLPMTRVSVSTYPPGASSIAPHDRPAPHPRCPHRPSLTCVPTSTNTFSLPTAVASFSRRTPTGE